MGYQALLFCPDDKTARTVTQVLSELEFAVEACIEPFAAVKKLMGQHFDAVVVDCDNEQNATLLFKSARNSTSNQTSLAVAVVEGQAGVAKAFRIGANLVLTKPINIEQAKGTLRVARGLLRKSDPTKPASATATSTFAIPTAPTPAPATAPTVAAPAKPAPPKPAPSVKPAAPVAAKPTAPAVPAAHRTGQIPVPKPPAPSAWPNPATAKAAPAAQDAVPVAAAPAEPAAPPALYNAAVATPAAPKAPAAIPPIGVKRPEFTSKPASGGAASAPAPAREPEAVKEAHTAPAADTLFEKPAPASSEHAPTVVGSAPSFGYGKEEAASGGSKKILIGVAAGVVIAAAGYFGWTHFKGSASPAAQPVAVSTPAPTPASAPAKPSAQPSTPSTASNVPASNPQADVTPPTRSKTPAPEPELIAESRPSTRSTAASPAPAKPVETETPETTALVVKGGKVPTAAKPAAAPDAPAPSLAGMGAPTNTSLPNLGTTTSAVKPKLQMVSVSQGVSQGLLYKKVAPAYPPNALRMHVEGAVELQATISKNGDITNIKIVSGDPQLAKAASDAVKQWKYKPYLLNGEPVEIQTGVTVNFKLPR